MIKITKKSKILFLIYDNSIYLKKDGRTTVIPLEAGIILNGRINNVKKLVDNLKKSKAILNSFFKLVNDSFTMIYFSNYNDYELNNIINDLKENGIENIKMLDYQQLIKNDDETFILFNNNYYYLISSKFKIVLQDLHYISKYTNSVIISDQKSYFYIDRSINNTRIYTLDNVPEYIFNLIC